MALAEETRFARSRDAVRVCARRQNKGKSTAENPLDTKASAVLWFLDMPIQMCWTFAKKPLAAKPLMSCWLSVPVRDEKNLTADVQVTFLKGEFLDKDRVLYCWPPKNGPSLPGVQPGSLLLILKRFFGLNDAPRKWWEKISRVLVQIGFKKQRMCLGLFTLHSPAGILSGVICLHVDDMLGTGDGLSKLRTRETRWIRFDSDSKVFSLRKVVRETCQR